MNSQQFEELYKRWQNKTPNEKFWSEDIAQEYGLSSSEALRSSFRRIRNLRKMDAHVAKNVHKNNSPCNVILWDAETSPISALVWGIWDQNISTDAILEDWHFISYSAKFLFDDKIYSDVLTPEEARNHDDKRIMKSLWDILDGADILITHNGDNFDIPRAQTRFLFHNMPPLSHHRSIDTLKVAKSNFNFTSRKLDYINKFLGITQKTETGFELWKKCYFGDAESLKKMEQYNRNDVSILEETFLKMRPFIKNFPNLNMYTDENVSVCRNCASKEITWSGYYYTNVGKYKGWRCNDCGATGRNRFSETKKEKSKTVIV